VRILFVGTDNVSRSPMAEWLARAFLRDALGSAAATVSTSSAGTHAVTGDAMDPSSRLVLDGLGDGAAGFRVRRLTTAMVDEADLTLTMTRHQRRTVLQLAPRAMFRTYTLLEAADLVGGVDTGRLPVAASVDEHARLLVSALGAQRATRGRTSPEADDVPDPVGRRAGVHQRVGEQIVGALVPLLRSVCATDALTSDHTVALYRAA
jgi:protein-tyrosine-phosphatase